MIVRQSNGRETPVTLFAQDTLRIKPGAGPYPVTVELIIESASQEPVLVTESWVKRSQKYDADLREARETIRRYEQRPWWSKLLRLPPAPVEEDAY